MDNLMVIENLDNNSVQKTLEKIQRFQQTIQQSLKAGHDYDTIPGTQKPTLLKPGAEKISMLLGINPEYEFLDKTEDYEKGFFAYTIRCVLFAKGRQIGQGIGSCNSREKKYINQDACTIANTILKMAKKRAHVDATLQIACMSDVFVAENNELNERIRSELLENMTVEDAAGLKLTFGKHKGKTLGEIFKHDYGWIDWFKKNGKDEIVAKAIFVLENAIIETRQKKQVSIVPVVDEDGVVIEEGGSEENLMLENEDE